MIFLLLSAAHAGGSWSDDFSDDDISDWTAADGTYTVSGGIVSGSSASHYGPDLVIDPGMDEGVTSYTITYEISGVTSFGIVPDYASTSEYCQLFWWAGSTLYKATYGGGEVSQGGHTWSYSTWYTVEAVVTPGNVAVYEDGTLVYNGDLSCDAFTSGGMVGIGLHQGATMYLDEITVEWEYLDNDGDGYTEDTGDCDDADDGVHPGVTEICDGIDNDCDDATDDADDGLDADVYYADEDGDGFGDAGVTDVACALPVGFVEDDTDCDDTAEFVNPVATEICNAIDDDCDGLVDDDDSSVDLSTGTIGYLDGDEDGYGDAIATVTACDLPSGYLTDASDCNDTDAAVHPGAAEICNDIDDDCDVLIDDADSDVDTSTGSEWYADSDGDTYGDATTMAWSCDAGAGYLADATDCDDTLAAVNPDATEVCNGYDDDCDALVDDADADVDLTTASNWYADGDSDGYGDPSTGVTTCDAPAGYVAADTDCDDASADWHPGADEADCTDPNDYNCDGSVGYADVDEDAVAACEDCDDVNASVGPFATEVCNEIDDDCDGLVDDADDGLDITTASSWYADADADGYGDAAKAAVSCIAGEGLIADATDCDDTLATFHPGAEESDCTDPTDYNCDGSVGYADADADATPACLDCDDSSAAVNPGATEVCNDVDDDCDALVDDADDSLDGGTTTTWYADADGDGYGDANAPEYSCDQGATTVADATDCDDADATIYPGAPGWNDDCTPVVVDTGEPDDTDDVSDVDDADVKGGGGCGCDAGGGSVPGALAFAGVLLSRRRRAAGSAPR